MLKYLAFVAVALVATAAEAQTLKIAPLTQSDVMAVLQQVLNAGFEVIKTENLYTFDGQPGYSLGQGQ